MEEHIFGTFSTDELKLIYERALARGIHHPARALPYDPLPGEPFDLLVTTGADVQADELALFYTTGGEAPGMESAMEPLEALSRTWSVAAWGYITEWRARLPAFAEGTLLRYRIAWRQRGSPWRWASVANPQRFVEEALVQRDTAAASDLPAVESEFARSIDHFAPPPWAQEAIVYQVFLDRFARSDDAPWEAGKRLDGFHGGTLKGVTQRLPYIAALGATCIWLSPLFPSPTYHGYDATDYYTVEPRYGSAEDLRALITEAHSLGLRVILDLICNHVSDEHPRFREAMADPESEARAWFHLEDGGYRSFFGVRSMPELDTDSPAVRDYLTGAAVMWLRDYGVDGFRLDYAHGPSHAFWTHFWRAVKQASPDAWCFGEVIDTPEAMRGYAGHLDGVLDFHLGEGLRHVFAHRTRDLLWLDRFMRDHDAFFPPHERFSRPVFLDNHDMDRFIYRAAGNPESALRLASLFLYALPNPPLLYYGTEIGLEQRYSKSEFGLEVSREPMRWTLAPTEEALLAWFRRLARIRRNDPAMRPARRDTLHVTAEEYLGRHRREESTIYLAINRAASATTLRHEALRGAFVDLLAERTVVLDGALELNPLEGALLKPLPHQDGSR